MVNYKRKKSVLQPPNLSDLITRQSAEDGQLLIGCASANPKMVLDLAADLQPDELLDLDAREIWGKLQNRRDAIKNSDSDGRDIFIDIALHDGRAGRVMAWISRSIIESTPYFVLAKLLIKDIRDLSITLDKIGQLTGVFNG